MARADDCLTIPQPNEVSGENLLVTVGVVSERLKERYGHDAEQPTAFDTADKVMTGPMSEPLDGLIETILSQQSTILMTQRMAEALHAAFPSWQQALAAGPAEIQAVLAAARGNLTTTKAQYIHGVLARLNVERGELSLGFLRKWDASDARAYLRSFKGVGAKTANCVLLFNLWLPVQPIDTHLHRIALRLGWVSKTASPEDVGQALEAILPADWQAHYEFHLNGIEHGQATCTAQSPTCSTCVIRELCPWPRHPLQHTNT